MFPNETWQIILKYLYKSPNQCRLVCKDFNALMSDFDYGTIKDLITNKESYEFLINHGYKLRQQAIKNCLANAWLLNKITPESAIKYAKNIFENDETVNHYIKFIPLCPKYMSICFQYSSLKSFLLLSKYYGPNRIFRITKKEISCNSQIIDYILENFHYETRGKMIHGKYLHVYDFWFNGMRLTKGAANKLLFLRPNLYKKYDFKMDHIVLDDLHEGKTKSFEFAKIHGLVSKFHLDRGINPEINDYLIMNDGLIINSVLVNYSLGRKDDVFEKVCGEMDPYLEFDYNILLINEFKLKIFLKYITTQDILGKMADICARKHYHTLELFDRSDYILDKYDIGQDRLNRAKFEMYDFKNVSY